MVFVFFSHFIRLFCSFPDKLNFFLVVIVRGDTGPHCKRKKETKKRETEKISDTERLQKIARNKKKLQQVKKRVSEREKAQA